MVPEGWEIKALKDILSGSIRNGFSPIASDKETGFWVLGLGSLGDEGINVTEIKPVEPTDRVLQTKLSHGDFLVSRSNTPDKVGRSIYFRGEIENCSYPDLMMKFRIDESKVYPLFIEQKLKSSDVRAFFKNCAAGSSATMVKINKVILEKTPLLLPNIKEQKKIAQILSTWDKAITTTEQLLANSHQQKKALMQQLLTGKKRISGFKGKWRKLKLSAVTDMNSGGTPRSSVEEYYNGGIPWVSIADMTSKGKWIYSTDKTLSKKGLENSSARLYPENTVLYAMYASIGECSIARVPLCSSQAILGIRPKKELHYEYLYFFLCYLKEKIKLQGQQGTQSNLNAGMVKDFVINLPSIEEQKIISAVLNLADHQIDALQQKLNHLKQEKKALMQQLLTGKRRVKVEAA